MGKKETMNKVSFEFDEQGTKEVSRQIMDSYSSGFIEEGTALADSKEFAVTKEQ